MSEPEPVQLNFCWPVDAGCLGSSWDELEPSVQARAITLAAATLYRLTLGQVGGCPVTVRPCPPRRPLATEHAPSPFLYGTGWMYPAQSISGAWVNCLGGGGGCSAGCEIVLPGYVGRVDEVKVGADVIDPDDYKLLHRQGSWRVVWRGVGDCPFPLTQDLSKALGTDGSFSVTYLPAHEVDVAGAEACGRLASEFAKACVGKDCELPKTVRTVARQGVTMQMVVGAFENGLTGIRSIDAWVALYNPKGSKGAVTELWSPDIDTGVFE